MARGRDYTRIAVQSTLGSFRPASGRTVRAGRPCDPFKIALRSFENQMKMIAHEPIGMHLENRILTVFRRGFWKILAIHIIVENVLPTIPTTHDVVAGTWIFDAYLTWHDCNSDRFRQPVKSLL